MAVARLSWDPVEGASAYQLMVYDRTVAEVVVDERTPAAAVAEVSLPEERCSHDLLMRVRALRNGDWEAWTAFEPLPLGVVLGERRDPLPPLSPNDEPGLLLVFTVDTEGSVLRQPQPSPDRVVDELIFGEFGDGGKPGGIGLHMDLLEHFGFRGCFFVDVLMEYQFGRRALERTIEAIGERGHEIELHVHADHLDWSSDTRIVDLVADLSSGKAEDPEVFRRLIELSVELFERRVGRRPIAYRAGGYRIANTHFPVLEEFGIRIDSSVQPYFNSHVSDWMRTRTQPFRVGGVLEVPPSLIVLNEKPEAWEVRGFTPSSELGDPVSVLPAGPEGIPRVATFVSHSFQLLRCRQSEESEEVERFGESLRSAIPRRHAERLLRLSTPEVRAFGPDVESALVSPVAGVLRRIADRPDARCATYADLLAVADRYWPAERHSPVDPIPVLDRRRGIAGASGTRIYSEDFLVHLSTPRPSFPGSGHVEPRWLEGLERGDTSGLHGRLKAFVEEAAPRGPVRLRLRTLGVDSPQPRRMFPPLAELLFPRATLCAVAAAAGEGEEDEGVPPWDVPTYVAWLERGGFEVVSQRRLPRSSAEMSVLEPHAEKLAWLDPLELSTAAVELELRKGDVEPRPCSDPWLDPIQIQAIAEDSYSSTHPGEEARFNLAELTSPASRTTRLLALMRAGFEPLGREGCSYRFIRPLELSDLRRFAGLS